MKKEESINDPLYSSSGKRAENQEKLISIIEEWLKTYEKIDEVAALLDKNGIASCKVNNMDDIMNDPQVNARGMIVDMEAPALSEGKVKARGSA